MNLQSRLVFGLATLVVALAGVRGVRAQVFTEARTFPSGGTNPNCVIPGDFNGDGKLDLAVVNKDNTVAVLLGKGKGFFENPRVFSVNQGSFLLCGAAGDFNGDGKLDLVVPVALVGTSGGTVALLLGNGDGTFQPPIFIPSGVSPLSIAVADLNHDGHLDLFVGGNGSSSVLLGNGDGTFGQPIIVATGTIGGDLGVAIGDFNNDGNLDLVGTNLTESTVGVLLGNGDGTFQPAQVFNVGFGFGSFPDAVVVGDFNRDGKLDLAVGDFGDGVVNILLGNGDGTFQPAVFYFGGQGIGSLQAADLNGDGIADLVASNFNGDGVMVLLGNGDGTFNLGPDFVTGLSPTYVAVADLNNDRAPDLAVADFGSNDVAILLNKRHRPGFYTVTDLGSLEGASAGSLASDINDRGAVAANSLPGIVGEEAFVWQGGKRTRLPSLGGRFSSAKGINSAQVVGQANLPGDQFGHASLWNNGQVTDLGTLGGNNSIAFGINDQQQVVGQADTGGTTGSGGPISHAFLKVGAHNPLQDLGTLGGDNSASFAINHLEQAVGQSDITTTPDPIFGVPPFHGFIWQGGVMQDLGLAPIFGGTFNVAQDINDHGQVVGSADLTNDQVAHAFVWQNGSAQDLGALTGDTASVAFGINNQGQAVGISGFSGTSFGLGPPVTQFTCPCHAVIWENGKVFDLDTMIPGNSPWQLVIAVAINDRGQIVGEGIVKNQVRAFLLTPVQGAPQDEAEQVFASPNSDAAASPITVRVVREGKGVRVQVEPR